MLTSRPETQPETRPEHEPGARPDVPMPGTGQAQRILAPADLVGRETEVISVAGRLRAPATRLLTVTGPPGVGKSRVAAAAVAQAPEVAGRGLRVVDLTQAVDAEGAAAAVAESAAELMSNQKGADERALLLLDGCEHVAEEVAPAVAQALDADHGLTVLATSQRPLRVYGERLVPVAPLALPDPELDTHAHEVQEFPAVELFVRRAQEANPEFVLTAENVRAVAGICRLLDGLPLPIELAAGRMRLHPPETLLHRLRRGGEALAGGPVNAPPRHRSLAAIGEWACHGVPPQEQVLLEHLAVFDGEFGLPMVEKVCPLPAAEVEAALESLLDRSLVSAREQQAGEARFALLWPVRARHLAVLRESGRLEEVRGRHAARYQQLLRTVEPRLSGSEQGRWLRVLAREHDNILAALRHVLEQGEWDGAAAMVAACHRPWLNQGYLRDGLRWCATLLEEAPTSSPAGAEELLRLRARLLTMSGSLLAALGDHGAAAARHRRAVALYKEAGDRRQGLWSSARLGLELFRCGDEAVGRSLITGALAATEAAGDTAGSAEASAALAVVLRPQGQVGQRKDLLERTAGVCRATGDARGLAAALLQLAEVAAEQQDGNAAREALHECLRLYDGIGERTELADALEAFGLQLGSSAGQQLRAIRLFAAAEALRRRTHARIAEARWAAVSSALAELRRQVGWAAFTTAWGEGLRLRPAAAVAEALAAERPRSSAQDDEPTEVKSLTARQLQVAMLVAEGLTNRQIANRLAISEWTVVNHVRHVMRRLGCSSRVQVAWSIGRRR
jgi:predicted ATPase/DNA-binding CsgD family transcriptional regulator